MNAEIYSTGINGDVTLQELNAIANPKPNATFAGKLRTAKLVEKRFNTPGLESDMLFSIESLYNNYTTKGRIYIQFSNAYPAKLNRLGKVDCYVNASRAYCKFFENQMIEIHIPHTLLYM